jgi:hypothetical protein
MTVLIVLAVLLWTLTLVLAVLGKLLRAPDRAARVSVRPLPWPRIDIDLGAHGVHKNAHKKPDREISTG